MIDQTEVTPDVISDDADESRDAAVTVDSCSQHPFYKIDGCGSLNRTGIYRSKTCRATSTLSRYNLSSNMDFKATRNNSQSNNLARSKLGGRITQPRTSIKPDNVNYCFWGQNSLNIKQNHSLRIPFFKLRN